MTKKGTAFIIAGLVAAALAAQTWRGAETLEIQVDQAKGGAVVGARIALTFQGVPGETGPPVVLTDAKGQAVVADLAAGPWQVEISHEDFLSYVAMIDIRRGKKPLVSASFLEAGGRSLTPVKVKFAKGNPAEASPFVEEPRVADTPPPPQTQVREKTPAPVTEPRTAAPEPGPSLTVAQPTETTPPPAVSAPSGQAVEPQPTAPSPESDQTADAADSAAPPPPETTPEPAELPDAAVGAPEVIPESPRPQPVAEPEPQAPAEPEPMEPQPAPAPVPAVVPEPEIRQAEVSPPVDTEPAPAQQEPAAALEPQPSAIETPSQPQPAPEPEVESVTETAPAVAAEPVAPEAAQEALPPTPIPSPTAATPAPSMSGPPIISYRDESCEECDTGVWAVTADGVAGVAPSPESSCPPTAYEELGLAMRNLGMSINLELAGYLGPVIGSGGTDARSIAEPDLTATLDRSLAPYLDGSTACRLVAVVLPKIVRLDRVRVGAGDRDGNGDCVPDQGCAVGEATWLRSVRVEKGPSATVVWGLFENSAVTSERLAWMRVYFRPPNANWRPRTTPDQ